MIKECLGRYGLMVTAVLFSLGVVISTVSPSWISQSLQNYPTTGQSMVVEFGPFYSRNRTCTSADDESTCAPWGPSGINADDCNYFKLAVSDPDTQDKLCTQNNAWRVMAMFCNFIVVGTAILVGVATFTQCLTCGCCGGSFDVIAMIAYWIEVVLSIIAWGLCISVVTILRGEDVQDIVLEEFQNIQNAQDIEDFEVGSGFLWGFWLFIFSGTFMGALSAIFADWASEGSLLKCLGNCVLCLLCCKK
jgi:hypothetical protein